MTNFDFAYISTMQYEGGYVNDPADRGGETYNGISRRAHPDWKGWAVIDVHKRQRNFPENLENNSALNSLVKGLYKTGYYDVFNGDLWPIQLSAVLFNIAVNCGVNTAIEYLQRTLNLLNDNQKRYSDVVVDRIYGSTTGVMLSACLKARPCDLICTVLRSYQAKRYIEIMESRPTQEKYIGWFNRLSFTNK
jgi:lysozyme family protein